MHLHQLLLTYGPHGLGVSDPGCKKKDSLSLTTVPHVTLVRQVKSTISGGHLSVRQVKKISQNVDISVKC